MHSEGHLVKIKALRKIWKKRLGGRKNDETNRGKATKKIKKIMTTGKFSIFVCKYLLHNLLVKHYIKCYIVWDLLVAANWTYNKSACPVGKLYIRCLDKHNFKQRGYLTVWHFIHKECYWVVSNLTDISNVHSFKKWFCVGSRMNSTDYTNNLLLKNMQSI